MSEHELIELVKILGFSPLNTVLLFAIWLTIRKKIKEHDKMYHWYIGHMAIQEMYIRQETQQEENKQS